jgi:hypothetical protein
LWEAEFKSDILVNPAEKTLRHPKIQAVIWILLASFSHIYYKNRDQRAEQKDLKNL